MQKYWLEDSLRSWILTSLKAESRSGYYRLASERARELALTSLLDSLASLSEALPVRGTGRSFFTFIFPKRAPKESGNGGKSDFTFKLAVRD